MTGLEYKPNHCWLSSNPKAHILSYSGGSPNHFTAFEHHSALSTICGDPVRIWIYGKLYDWLWGLLLLLLVIHCAEHDDKKITGQQECTYTKYLTQMMCERSEEEEERKREREDCKRALPNAQLHSSAFFMALLERNEQKTHFLHATLKRPFFLPTYPDCGIFFMLENIMSVQQKPMGEKKSVDE